MKKDDPFFALEYLQQSYLKNAPKCYIDNIKRALLRGRRDGDRLDFIGKAFNRYVQKDHAGMNGNKPTGLWVCDSYKGKTPRAAIDASMKSCGLVPGE